MLMVAEHYRKVLRLQEEQLAMPPPPPPTRQHVPPTSAPPAPSARSTSRPSRSRNRGGAINYFADEAPSSGAAAVQASRAESTSAAGAAVNTESLPWKKAFDAARELQRTEVERCADADSLAKIRAIIGEM
eukprot:3336353-Pleurochrysis_carterae.AAC.1